jgi:hypothetical protein
MKKIFPILLFMPSVALFADWQFFLMNGLSKNFNQDGIAYSTSNLTSYNINKNNVARFSSSVSLNTVDINAGMNLGFDSKITSFFELFYFTKFLLNRIESSPQRMDTGIGTKFTFISLSFYKGSISGAPIWTNEEGMNNISASFRQRNSIMFKKLLIEILYWYIINVENTLHEVDFIFIHGITKMTSIFASYGWIYQEGHNNLISLGYILNFK